MIYSILEKLGLFKPDDYEHRRFRSLAKLCESPIEKAFWSVGYFPLSKIGVLTPQVQEGPYRIDFVLVPNNRLLKVAVELDGQEYHKTKEQRAHDYKRERYLQHRGWKIIRFTGSEIYGDAEKCVKETLELVKQYQYWLNVGGR